MVVDPDPLPFERDLQEARRALARPIAHAADAPGFRQRWSGISSGLKAQLACTWPQQ